MQYEVPQYIEEEAKIAGPFNIKQFLVLFGGILFCAVFFSVFKFGTALILSMIVLGSLAGLMLGKYNGRKLSEVVLSAIKYLWVPKTYVWRKKPISAKDIFIEERRHAEPVSPEPKQFSKSFTPEQLQELAKQLDKKQNE